MFYSNEIWCCNHLILTVIFRVVATIGPRGGGTRKVSRKAIEEVDIRRACEKIIEPGAPISLRLQSNLLYGISRVYSSQCNYMLADAEKVQTLMKTFFRLIANNETDPKAGRARRDQITLSDDPSFVPTSIMPHFTIDDDGNSCFISGSHPSSGGKRKSQSQLSPFPHPVDLSGGREHSIFNLDISQSSSTFIYRLPSPFAHSSSAQKTLLPRTRDDMELNLNMGSLGPMDDFDNFGGVELEIDENGGVVVDEPEPELPGLVETGLVNSDAPFQIEQTQDEQLIVRDAEGDVVMMGSDPVFLQDEHILHLPQPPEEGQRDQSSAPYRKRRRVLKFDNDSTTIKRSVLKSWQEQYVDNAERATSKRKGTTQIQARANAYFLTFGQGIAGIGRITGIPGTKFPLADVFAGTGLRDIIYGPPSEEEWDLQTPSPKGRRRRAVEAFDEASDISEDRNVRPRVDETPQQGRSMDEMGGYGMMIGDESMPEMGMKAAQPMEEHPSSSLMPWNRTPSAGRGSSVISHSARRHEQTNRHKSASLRGSSAPPFEPLHDALGSDLGAIPIDMHVSQDFGPENLYPAGIVGNGQDDKSDSQWMRSTLDTASGEFLQWTEDEAKKTGQIKEGDNNENRRWINFDDLIEPAKQNHVVAAQAFYHVLCLTTKNAVSVEQQVESMQPFGPIRIGLDMTALLMSQE
ncbi:meiotic recombination protein rec8 [Colletotrichum spaethianum]|uniref:Meiotic recombination protein rec8 n=1 Tax=Colletotrichum spaethianum TaxID=700344 RepID=A0AA37L8D6_9PEZI|nr:meiotic recombination protein rec8 [Colletotrichum spaethianum]GKT42549.1 meiotic recombination protein rec8 [Colletotrichum spaethianum]